jgi:hypothetical protein
MREGWSARIRFKIEGEISEIRTFRRVQRAAVSEADKPFHARVNSRSVCGRGTGAGVGVACDRRGVDDTDADPDPRVVDRCICGCVGSFGAGAGTGTSRVLKTVSCPDTGKIPPPMRPAFFSSRTCFASLNDAGSGFGVVPSSAVGTAVDLGSRDAESRRELIGLNRSFVGTVFAGMSESTVVMGTRRRFGGAAAEDVDDTGGGVTMSTGAVRCTTKFVDKQGEMRTREHTVFPFPLKMSSSTRSSSTLTASFFGSILSAHCRSA